jgi:hypothetical protein
MLLIINNSTGWCWAAGIDKSADRTPARASLKLAPKKKAAVVSGPKSREELPKKGCNEATPIALLPCKNTSHPNERKEQKGSIAAHFHVQQRNCAAFQDGCVEQMRARPRPVLPRSRWQSPEAAGEVICIRATRPRQARSSRPLRAKPCAMVQYPGRSPTI